ncbi:hypothetical protein [Actinophytocola sp.]|uniref:hypothetical protein n=1 Tax=Actinophytocola sp. TaxID=1872138 RepID=UPI0025BF2EA5|nr:hypothetical protein [Actinophytocola sp.]
MTAGVAWLCRVERIRHREVWFTAPAVLDLRTPDDVFLVGSVFPVGRTRADLALVSAAARFSSSPPLLALRSRCGGPVAGPAVEVVASFVGRRTYSRYDLEDAAGTAFPGYVSRRPMRCRGDSPWPTTRRCWRCVSPAGHCTGARTAHTRCRGACIRHWPRPWCAWQGSSRA